MKIKPIDNQNIISIKILKHTLKTTLVGERGQNLMLKSINLRIKIDRLKESTKKQANNYQRF